MLLPPPVDRIAEEKGSRCTANGVCKELCATRLLLLPYALFMPLAAADGAKCVGCVPVVVLVAGVDSSGPPIRLVMVQSSNRPPMRKREDDDSFVLTAMLCA